MQQAADVYGDEAAGVPPGHGHSPPAGWQGQHPDEYVDGAY
jgi:hypothetical protein